MLEFWFIASFILLFLFVFCLVFGSALEGDNPLETPESAREFFWVLVIGTLVCVFWPIVLASAPIVFLGALVYRGWFSADE